MTPQERLQAHLEARSKLGGGPAVRADANGNPVFSPVDITGLSQLWQDDRNAALEIADRSYAEYAAQITIEDGETK